MKIAIVGAGVSGLASARRAVENNLQCTVFEMTASIGGIWVYTENTDKNEFINPTYASLRYVHFLRHTYVIKFQEIF